jgi:hypothetical protein
MAGLVVLAALVALGAASALGLTVDSRNRCYGLGRVIDYRRSGQTKKR